MKWPILGIITVVFLQLGFTAFNAVNRPMASLITVNALTTGTNPVAVTLENWLASDRDPFAKYPETEEAASPRINTRETETAFIAEKRSLNVPAGEKGEARSQLVAMNRPFETITITYPKPPRPGGESDYQTASYVATSTENRSFVAKSVAVIKRPYKWLKTLGSKFD
jgi:hypothetical protein